MSFIRQTLTDPRDGRRRSCEEVRGPVTVASGMVVAIFRLCLALPKIAVFTQPFDVIAEHLLQVLAYYHSALSNRTCKW